MSKVYIVNNYIKLLELGRGSFGVAYKCMNELTGQFYCIKTLKKNIHNSESNINDSFLVLNEALNNERLSQYENKYFSKFYEFIYTKDYIYIIMEYIDDFIPLSELIPFFDDILTNPYTKNTFKSIVENLCSAVSYMHSLGIDHSDLKPDNILVNTDTGEIKIIDYGNSCYKEDCKLDFGYTISYVDPVLIKMIHLRIGDYSFEEKSFFKGVFHKTKHEINFIVKEQADLWSLGCIIYEMLTCTTLYSIYNTGKPLHLTKDGFNINFIKNYDYSKDVNRDILDDMIKIIGIKIDLNNLLSRTSKRLLK